VIRHADIQKCGNCEKRFDVNFAERMSERQRQHRLEQPHLFGSCGFLQRHYEPKGMTAELYDTPWEDRPHTVFFHSDECEQAYIHADSFGYRDCEACCRTLCQQHPGNGWMWQFREHAELGEICLRCYQDEILENGQPRSDFSGSKISGGMFFSGDNREPLAAGFEEVDGFENYFVHGCTRALMYNQRALELIDAGRKVVTGFERLAIGGLEGYITMFAKSESPKSFRC